MNIAYFRVSKEKEDIQDLNQQIKKVIEKFKLNRSELIVFKERGSAYDLDKFSKRKEFIEMMNYMFKSKVVTIEDLFKKNIKIEEEEINLYIWDYSRIMRNLEFNLLFTILCCFYSVRIYSYKDGLFKIDDNMTPTEKLAKYLDLSIRAYSAEEYSWNISTNIKKVVKEENGVKISSRGNVWGRKFRKKDGSLVELSTQEIENIYNYVIKLRKKEYTYQEIIDNIDEKFNIFISKAFINKVTTRLNPHRAISPR